MSIKLSILRRAFVDVCKGFSVGEHNGNKLYIRHLGHKEHIEYDDLQLSFESWAINQKAPTEEERLIYLHKKGLWTDSNETEIIRQKDTIFRFQEGKKSMAIPSMIKNQEEAIIKEKSKLNDILFRRSELIGMTAELYALQRLEDYYLVNNLFRDKDLIKPFFATDSFDELDDSDIEFVKDVYRKAIEPCLDENLKWLSVQDFFTSYYSLCQDNLQAFFGKPICELTYYQVKLGNMARYYKSIIENIDINKLSPETRHDPEALERSYLMQKNTSATLAEGRVPTNMTQEDLKQTGLGNQLTKLPPTNLSGVELVKWLRSQHPPNST